MPFCSFLRLKWQTRFHLHSSCTYLKYKYCETHAYWHLEYYYSFKYVARAILHAIEVAEICSAAQYCRRRCNLIWASPPLFVVLCRRARRVWTDKLFVTYEWRFNREFSELYITRRSFMNPNSFTSISDTTKLAISFGNKNDISKFQKFVTPCSNKYELYVLPRRRAKKQRKETRLQMDDWLYDSSSNSIVNDECISNVAPRSFYFYVVVKLSMERSVQW